MKVNIVLEFRDAQDLRKTVEVLWRAKCPLTQEKNGCEWCNYKIACAKVRDITYKLEERFNADEE